MLYFGYNVFNKTIVVDVKNDNFNELDFNHNKAVNINKKIQEAIINGNDPRTVDTCLGIAISKKLTCSFSKNTTDLLWNNTELLLNMLSTELKPFIYWLNEYLDINDVYTLINTIANHFIIEQRNMSIDTNDAKDLINVFSNILNN